MSAAGERQAREQIRQVGLELVSLAVTSKCHLKARLRAPDGRETLYVFAGTPSDNRSAKNALSALKRFARPIHSATAIPTNERKKP